ncbi:MAG TPA: bifunctional acetate--CoA ligase family protein/GNAT family N-acetyltransferase [Steroidobacteraceae bacterium]|nr:bifunctional acetate--CoA ligase family protein/GNAT family N-acetyltransferase [Steroidobacteraceae bacterium]
MSSRNLEHLFDPRSVALIGASDRPHSIGATVMRNLLRGGFGGTIRPVNPRHAAVAGRQAFPTVESLPSAPELAVICTPAPTVPGITAALGARGTRAAIVISSGLEQAAPGGGTLAGAMLRAAKPFQLRILGPNCIGVLVPRIGLDASFAHVGASSGTLAFVAQSGALTTALLDWARGRQVGFSHFISLGNAADVDFGDLLDYLGRDPGTRAILLYVESISSARKFMSAARATARAKPIIVVKSGRTPASARAAQSHSGALAGSDAVYDAAFRRAGILRVDTLRELFDAAEILSRWRRYAGPRLAIVTNGGGPAVLATDALIRRGGELAELSAASMRRLDQVVPGAPGRANPLDIGGDARAERYLAALDVVLEDPGVDALLLMHAPTAVASVAEIAAACAPKLAGGPRPALACWLGAGTNGFPEASALPSYPTPEEAVGAFQHVVRYHQSQALLLEAPAVTPEPGRPDIQVARAIVARALAEKRQTLTEPESKAILAAYGIPVVETRIVRDEEGLGAAAREIGYPVALKILSPDISHKSDVGGVALNIDSGGELEHAAATMLQRCRAGSPAARIEGFTVQKMVRRGGAHELLAGIAVDKTFGPAIVFGQGGTAVELIADRALALPPLNARLARELLARTRVHRLLLGYRDHPPADTGALERALVSLSQLAADVPEIVELDVNPLLAGPDGVVALDARIRLEPTALHGSERFAIRPYPMELEETVRLDARALRLRPIRPEDFAQHKRFLARCSPEDLHARFLSTFRELPEAEIARLTQIDYDREMAFIAEETDQRGATETLGVARVSTDPDNVEAEFAVLVRSDVKRRGLGRLLLAKLINYCRDRGTVRMKSSVLSGNACMLGLGAKLGFTAQLAERGIMDMCLELQSPSVGRAAPH